MQSDLDNSSAVVMYDQDGDKRTLEIIPETFVAASVYQVHLAVHIGRSYHEHFTWNGLVIQ